MNQKNGSKLSSGSLISQIPGNERGQILPLAALMMSTLFCICGFVIDLGRVYVSYHQLQASTDAAALAAGYALSLGGSTTQSTADKAELFSSKSSVGGTNTAGVMTGVSITTSVGCLTMVSSTPFSIPCFGAGSYNAVRVVQTASVPMTFANFFGSSPVSLSATATAAMASSPSIQYNVAIIVDTTQSMTQTDSGGSCSSTRLTCALNGVVTFLGELTPCSISLGCGNTFTTGEPTNAFDHVSLFTFPNVPATTVTDDTNCSGTAPQAPGYSFPPASGTLSGYTPIKPTGGSTVVYYQVTPYLSNFRPSNNSSGSTLLNGSSTIVDAVGGKSGCTAMGAPGGAGTFYAGVIYAAQQSLVAEAAAVPGSQNVMIIISDGDASSGYSQSPISSPNNSYSTKMPGASTTSTTYPSVIDQCGEAVAAATAAKNAGTKIYAIAYGAESSGCATDTQDSYTPCSTMEAIASTPLNTYFFSDYAQSGGGQDTSCIGAADPTTNINQIFSDIKTNFNKSRLIPNSVNGYTWTWTTATP